MDGVKMFTGNDYEDYRFGEGKWPSPQEAAEIWAKFEKLLADIQARKPLYAWSVIANKQYP